MVCIHHQPVSRQQVGQSPGLAAAHGVGLTREGERTRAFLADLSGEQVQVDQTLHHRSSFAALVHSHRPEAQNLLAPMEQAGHFAQAFFGDVAEQGHAPWRPAGGHIEKSLVVLGVVVDEGGILAVLPQHKVSDPMQQSQIAARSDRQVDVSGLGGVCAAWVDHHDREAPRIPLFAFQQSLEQHRVAFSGVGADEEGHTAMVEILIAAGGTI